MALTSVSPFVLTHQITGRDTFQSPLIMFPPRNNKTLDMRVAERQRFMCWISFTQFHLISYEVKVQNWDLMMLCSWCATRWQPDLWDDDKTSESSLSVVVFNHLLLLNLHWLIQLRVLRGSQLAASSQAQTCHLLSSIPVSYQISLKCYYVWLYYYWCRNPITDNRVIIPSLKLLLVMESSSYI